MIGALVLVALWLALLGLVVAAIAGFVFRGWLEAWLDRQLEPIRRRATPVMMADGMITGSTGPIPGGAGAIMTPKFEEITLQRGIAQIRAWAAEEGRTVSDSEARAEAEHLLHQGDPFNL